LLGPASSMASTASIPHQFVEFALQQEVLRFGEFALKSGRQSPYFFNAGLFSTGEALARLGEFYADAIVASKLDFDCIFGPAYKGIPLAAAVAISLFQKHKRSVPYAYNRKEAKDHGEGGVVVGTLGKRVLVVDDVITAGTAIRECMDLISSIEGCKVVGVVVALDRAERVKEDSDKSAIQQVRLDFGIDVLSVASMGDLISYLEECYKNPDRGELLTRIKEYRQKFGTAGGDA